MTLAAGSCKAPTVLRVAAASFAFGAGKIAFTIGRFSISKQVMVVNMNDDSGKGIPIYSMCCCYELLRAIHAKPLWDRSLANRLIYIDQQRGHVMGNEATVEEREAKRSSRGDETGLRGAGRWMWAGEVAIQLKYTDLPQKDATPWGVARGPAPLFRNAQHVPPGRGRG